MENQKLETHGQRLIKLALYCVIMSHLLLFTTLLASLLVLPFCTPWYVFVPLCSWIVRLPYVDGICPITELESKIRVKLGQPPIRSFIKQNILRNYVKIKKYFRKI